MQFGEKLSFDFSDEILNNNEFEVEILFNNVQMAYAKIPLKTILPHKKQKVSIPLLYKGNKIPIQKGQFTMVAKITDQKNGSSVPELTKQISKNIVDNEPSASEKVDSVKIPPSKPISEDVNKIFTDDSQGANKEENCCQTCVIC